MRNFDLTLLADFIVDASENLDEMELLLLQLQLVDSPGDVELFNEIFRPVHTIQGAAQFMGFQKIAGLSHRLEDLLDQLRSGSRLSTQAIVEILITVRDRIMLLVSELEQSQQEVSGIDDLIEKLNIILDSGDKAQYDFTGDLTELPTVSHTAAGQVNKGQVNYGPLEKDPVDNVPIDEGLAEGREDEVDDQELFELYLNHLQQQLRWLVNQMTGLNGAGDKKNHIDQCIQTLNKVRSSAICMGFEEIGEFYQGWIEALIGAKKSVSKGQDVAFSFMDSYLDELKQYYPQIDYSTQSQPQQTETGIKDLIAELNSMPN